MTIRKRVITTFTMLLVILPSMGGIARAAIPAIVGGFEIDGNMAFDSLPTATKDWSNASPIVIGDSYAGDANPALVDDIYKGGSKDADPSGWSFVDQSVPSKDDFTRIYASSQINGPDNGFLWLAFERLGVSGAGDAHVDFELNRLASTTTYPADATLGGSVSVPTRSPGDLRVAYHSAGGTGPVDISVFQWSGTATSGSWVPASPPPNTAVGEINRVPITRSISDPRFATQTID